MSSKRSSAASLRRALALASALPLLAACGALGSAEAETRVVHGEAVAVGEGVARAYLLTGAGGEPLELGVALSEGALRALPDGHHGAIAMPDGHVTHEFVLALPPSAPAPFRHAGLNWNPGGHEPPGIYDRPHFDFHFYTIDVAERMAIDPADPEFQRRAETLPAPEFVPRGYVMPAPLAFPRMGVHWVDPTSPELNGETFTRTFIHGSWDGKLIFWEPMITREFLESRPDVRTPVPSPREVAEAGHYPTEYRVRWDAEAREYRIALAGFVRRDPAVR